MADAQDLKSLKTPYLWVYGGSPAFSQDEVFQWFYEGKLKFSLIRSRKSWKL